MSNEEAIKWLKAIKDKYIHGGDEAFDECRKEALDMAIKALKDRSQGKWKILVFKTLNEKDGDIIAYECSCCGAVVDKKYQHCPNPKCLAQMKGGAKMKKGENK
jgi:hypothetical protein